jgi:hypothetical protein
VATTPGLPSIHDGIQCTRFKARGDERPSENNESKETIDWCWIDAVASRGTVQAHATGCPCA